MKYSPRERACAGAHPRGCGEHRVALNRVPPRWGSSPRVRGTYTKFANIWLATGLIPAGAGNIQQSQALEKPSGAHPRGCGEHSPATSHRVLFRGSSPRVRGTSHHRPGHPSYTVAHPRGCGEHVFSVTYCCTREGSSPRVRGTSRSSMSLSEKMGLIPAGAGNICVTGGNGNLTGWLIPAGAGNIRFMTSLRCG